MIRRAWRRYGPSAAAKASTSVKATSASRSVKPARRSAPSTRLDRDAAGVPVDTDLIFGLFTRESHDRSRGCPVRIETDDSRAALPQLVHAEDIDDDITGNRNVMAALAEKDTAPPVKRNAAFAPGQHRAETLATKQGGGFERQGFQPSAPRARHHRDRKRSNQGDDEHHRHDLDQREA